MKLDAKNKMMKLCLVFFLFISCGCLMHSQEFSSSTIIKLGEVVIIQNQESSSGIIENNTEKKSGTLIRKTQKKQNKNILKNHTKLNVKDSRKNYSEKPKTQTIIYKNSEGDSVFSTSSGKNISAVFSSTSNFDLKKDFNGYNNHLITFFKEHLIKKNTYFYLFSRDTGELYQFFNKPPPTAFFS